MAKEEVITLDGVVQELMPNATSRVKLENGHTCVCVVSGRLRKNRIRILSSDKVRVEISPYDTSRGRICFRY